MGKIIGWIAAGLVVVLAIGMYRSQKVGISTPDETIVVPAGRWIGQPLLVDKVYSRGSVEARLDLRHISGPAVDVLVLDKSEFVLIDTGGKATSAGPRTTARVWERLQAVHAKLKARGFADRLTTDWVEIGEQKTLYLVVLNPDKTREARVKAILTVRR